MKKVMSASLETTGSSSGIEMNDSIETEEGHLDFTRQPPSGVFGQTIIGILAFVVTLSAGGTENSDSLRMGPIYPTVYDSVTFTFIDPHACCVTIYHNKYISVSGDNITVYYSFDNHQCHPAFCSNEPNWVSATSHHVPAGGSVGPRYPPRRT